MQGLANKWKALLQTQSNQQLKLSRSGTNKREDQNRSSYKDSITEDPNEYSKKSKERLQKTKEQKKRGQRTISNQKRKLSNTKQKYPTESILDTPSKLNNKKSDKIIERYTNAIIQLLQENQANRLRGKVKGLLQDMSTHIESQGTMTSSLRVGVGDRAYHQLQLKYFESQKQRLYLKGKMQMSAKRYEGLQRQLQRYNKIQKLIDSSIFRQNELRQEITRLKTDKAFLQSQIQQQKQMFSKEVECIRQLIESLKMHLPIN